MTAEGRPPEVLVAWQATVGEGGRAGTVRVRARGTNDTAVGDPVELPAEPGTYTFPAPHIRWDYRSGRLGIVQETGGHAILERSSCASLGTWCGARIHVDRGNSGERIDGVRPTLKGIFEPDIDEDFRGDVTEDLTDLRSPRLPSPATTAGCRSRPRSRTPARWSPTRRGWRYAIRPIPGRGTARGGSGGGSRAASGRRRSRRESRGP